MTRNQADKIATQLIECGVNRKQTLTIVAEANDVSVQAVKTIKQWLLKHGASESSIICQAEMLENGWADEELNLTV